MKHAPFGSTRVQPILTDRLNPFLGFPSTKTDSCGAMLTHPNRHFP
ncbi:hypothetical protein EVA_21633 [gut metagenome]|uniref:Uncharacterized protein n=1 Tax=gut metagenome TaxID=749906 RepID=J9FSB3_9ZZZZ